MLQFQLDTLEGVDESLHALYTEKEGKFFLGVEGIPEPDVSGLKSKVDELLAEKKAATQKTREAEEAARIASEEAARKSGDTAALEKSWQDKLAAREKELMDQLSQRDGAITGMTVDSVASQIANELALPGSAALLIPHIKARLAAEQRDGQFVTVVRDAKGQPSASTLDDLKNEFTSNPAFAPVLVGSKANGGGATGSSGGGGAVTKKFNEMNGGELSALRKSNPTEYDRLKAERDSTH